MPIGIKMLNQNKKYKGPLPKSKPPKNARPNHPMNTEKTTGLKEDPVYKAGGGKILNCRS